MIIFGTGSGKIANFEINADKCGYCEIDAPQKITVFGRYFDVFWIPVFPIGKKAVAECTHCKKTISQRDFSPKLKEAYQKHKLKTPLKHWFLSLLVGVLIAILSSISIISLIFGGESNVAENDSEKDYRSELLKIDINAMVANPSETDTLSFTLNKELTYIAEDKNIECFTKVEGDKILVLVKIPSLKDFEKKERPKVIEVIEYEIDGIPSLKDKERYIGVHGKYNMMLIKTPSVEKNSRLLLTGPLYDFYEVEPLKRSDYILEKENIIFRDIEPKLSGEVLIRYTESYGSKCCPRDLKHDNNIFMYAKKFKNKHNIKRIEAFSIHTGKEGEFTAYFTLKELTLSQKKEFIQNRSLIFLEDTREEYLKSSRNIMENPIELSKKRVEKLKKIVL